MTNILTAARYLVFLSYEGKKSSLTHLKLQKILYLAQGWSFVWDNKPLFPEEFVAWQYGPVNTEIYNHFQKYRRDEIPSWEGSDVLEDEDVISTLEAVWNEYADYSAFALVNLTHMQDPWKNAYGSKLNIDNDAIKEYFQSTYN